MSLPWAVYIIISVRNLLPSYSHSHPSCIAVAPRQVLTYDRSGFATQATAFTGWSRMALPLLGTGPQPQHNQQQNQSERPRGFRIIEVQPARVGEEVPSRVVGEFGGALIAYCAKLTRKPTIDV